MVAHTKPQQRTTEERARLRGERNQIKFIDLRFEAFLKNYAGFKPINIAL